MTQYKYNQQEGRIWLDIPEPHLLDFGLGQAQYYLYTGAMKSYNTRPSYPVSPIPDWEDGKLVQENIHFKLRYDMIKISTIAEWKITAIPIPAVESKPDEEDISDKKLIEDVKNDSEITAIMEELNKPDEWISVSWLREKIGELRIDKTTYKELGQKYSYGWTDCINEVLELVSAAQPLSGTTPSSGANSSFNSEK